MYYHEKLTGRTAFRRGFLGRLVLRVQVKTRHGIEYWRDATGDDLGEVEVLSRQSGDYTGFVAKVI